jgi:cysteinyl-tRNA synthetase
MAYTYEQLNRMSVAELRTIADGIEHEAVKGHSTMHKEKLVPALCQALGIEAHKHHQAAGMDKAKLKLEIRSLKKKRDAVVASKDYKQLSEIRQRIHDIKVKLRREIG